MISRDLALAAARLLELDAQVLKQSNTLDGKWFLDCPQARADKRKHDKMAATAAELRRAAG